MKPIQPHQLRQMFAIARSLGMDSDDLHVLVSSLTGFESIKLLSDAQADSVVAELKSRQKAAGMAAPKAKTQQETRAGGVTAEQQRKVWALIGVLEKYDSKPSKADHRQRLCGIIKKEFGMDASPANPFRWLDMRKGIQLIDALQRYATSAERKALREGRVVDG